jgi:hypothetical protein
MSSGPCLSDDAPARYNQAHPTVEVKAIGYDRSAFLR